MIHTYIYTFIDTFQTGKKQFVKTAVKHDKLADTLNQFIDTQTEYTKSFINSVINLGSDVYSVVTTPKFTQEIVEVYNLDKFVPTAKAASKKAK